LVNVFFLLILQVTLILVSLERETSVEEHFLERKEPLRGDFGVTVFFVGALVGPFCLFWLAAVYKWAAYGDFFYYRTLMPELPEVIYRMPYFATPEYFMRTPACWGLTGFYPEPLPVDMTPVGAYLLSQGKLGVLNINVAVAAAESKQFLDTFPT
jgi:hypothetical protein